MNVEEQVMTIEAQSAEPFSENRRRNLAILLSGEVPISHHLDGNGERFLGTEKVDIDGVIRGGQLSHSIELYLMVEGLKELRRGKLPVPVKMAASRSYVSFVEDNYQGERQQMAVKEYLANLRTFTITSA